VFYHRKETTVRADASRTKALLRTLQAEDFETTEEVQALSDALDGASSEAEIAEATTALLRVLAPAGFAHIAGLYNAAGKRLAVIVGTADASAEEVMLQSRSTRESWLAVPEVVNNLERLSALIVECVRVTGRRFSDIADRPACAALGCLLTIPEGVSARAVDVAWRSPSTGRAGRWGALIALGVEIRVPCESLAAFAPYELAEPFQLGRVTIDPYRNEKCWQLYLEHQAEQAAQSEKQRREVRRVGGVA
jgi:hypothetical protein